MPFVELVERNAQVALPEERLLLRPRSIDDTTTRRVPVGHIQHDRPIAVLDEFPCSLDAVLVHRVVHGPSAARDIIYPRWVLIEHT